VDKSEQAAKYERALSIAHKWLYLASGMAEDLHNPGAGEDLYAMLKHVEELTEESLRGRKRPSKVMDGQLSLTE